MIAAPLSFAVRRLRTRIFSFAVLALALAGASGVIGWSTLTGARAQHSSVEQRLAEAPPK